MKCQHSLVYAAGTYIVYNHVLRETQTPMYPQEYQDLLEFLDSNPEYLHDMRVRLLSPELIALPEQFAQLVSVVAELSSKLDAFAEATDRRLNALEADVSTLKADVSTLKADVGTLKADVGTLKADVGTLKADVGTLKGSDLERRARESILNIAKDELNLTRGRILLARGRDTASSFLDSINTAEENGLITEQQADNVLVADIIIRARRADDKQYVHAVFEVSRTIRLSDIQRSHDRAATVAAATNEHTIAAVIGDVVQPPQQAQADAIGVQVLTPAMLRRDHTDDEATEPLNFC